MSQSAIIEAAATYFAIGPNDFVLASAVTAGVVAGSAAISVTVVGVLINIVSKSGRERLLEQRARASAQIETQRRVREKIATSILIDCDGDDAKFEAACARTDWLRTFVESSGKSGVVGQW